MSANEHDFRKLVAGLKTDDEPNPAHRARLRRQMLATFEQAGVRTVPAGVRSEPARTTGFPMARLALAAAILLAATAAVWVWWGSAGGPTALDRVLAATESVPWLHAVATRYSNGEVQTEQHWYNFVAREAYSRTEDGAVTAYDYGSEQMRLDYRPRLKTPTLIVSELPRTGPFGVESAYNLVQSFASFAARDNVAVEESTAEYEGRTVRTYGIKTADAGAGPDGRGLAELRMTVLADPRTKRIVAANVEHVGRAGNVLVREEWVMSYPSSGPASVYDLGVPATAQVLDMRQGYRGTPGDMPATFTPTPAPSGNFRLEPLKIELPRRTFLGTPRDARTPNQEKPRTGPRPAFLAPLGTTNVARGKPVSSSDPEPIAGSLDLITDGDKEALDGSFVELGPRPQHVTLDLQEQCEIYAVIIWHQHRWPRIYHDVVVQVSDDPTFRTGVRTIFNNDVNDSLGLGAGRDLHYTETYEGKLIDGKSTPGRYVRCYSNGNTHDELNHYLEIEVHGRPVRSIASN